MPKLNIIHDKLHGKVDKAVIDMLVRMQDQTATQFHMIMDLLKQQIALASVLRELMETTKDVLNIRAAKQLEKQIASFDKKHEQNSPLNPEDIDITSRTEGN
jgi:hypothetical protein